MLFSLFEGNVNYQRIKMNVLRWKVRKLAVVLLAVILVYFLLKCRQYTINGAIKIKNSPPNEVWEYVADFSNMMELNPTM